MSEAIRIDVVGGECTISFNPGHSTGHDPDTNPGILFDIEASVAFRKDVNGKYYIGAGVIRRSDVKRLREMLDGFLREFPAPAIEPALSE